MLGTKKTENQIHFLGLASQLIVCEQRVCFANEESNPQGWPLIHDEPIPVCGPS